MPGEFLDITYLDMTAWDVIGWDLSSLVAQAIPYSQDFSAGLPTGAQGWEYYSYSQGRIQVVGERLRMDEACIFSRIENEKVVMDVRTLTDAQVPVIAAAVRRVVQ